MRKEHTVRQVIPAVETLSFPVAEVKRMLYKYACGREPTLAELENIELKIKKARTFPPYFGRRLVLTITEVLTTDKKGQK